MCKSVLFTPCYITIILQSLHMIGKCVEQQGGGIPLTGDNCASAACDFGVSLCNRTC